MNCMWQIDNYPCEDVYETGCGESHIFIEGTPDDNRYKYCPYCGKPLLIERRWTNLFDDETDDEL